MSTTLETRRPNRLVRETSPYLQQHAYNPVDWYPWCEEALRRAKELDRPIFLSIGYSSCHWCHVMAHESFEDPEIAKVMNSNFINIKVDREERPDLDSIYMTAVQMLSGSGGWPMSVFLTSDLKPFWGGTYFPPVSRYGRPGFREILIEMARIYREQRDKIDETARELMRYLARQGDFRSDELPGEEGINAAVEHAKQTFDARNGGFGSAPKFPPAVEISMLLQVYSYGGDSNILAICEKTLEAMALGGMYDQIGGGFHRYSTDAKWLVPHFEKMLYDNALLARTYLDAYQLTGKDLYRRVAREVFDYVLQEMTSPEGGFYSATDADSEGKEGAFFVWTPDQVEETLGPEEAKLFCYYYNITQDGNFEGSTSIPNITRSPAEVAQSFHKDVGETGRILAACRQKLYEKRQKREKPFCDQKVLTAWNGLMISALARGAQVLGDVRYRDAAARAARLIIEQMTDDNRLLRVRKDGQSKIPGFLDDYAFFCEALIDLYETTFDPFYVERARSFTEALLSRFRDKVSGDFYYTAADGEALIVRRQEPFDNVIPSGNGVVAQNLLRLERLTGEAKYRSHAEDLLRGVKKALNKAPMSFSSTLIALDFYLHPPLEIAIIGGLEDQITRELLQVVHGAFLPHRVIAAAEPPIPASLAKAIPLLDGKRAVGEKTTVYLCRNFACQMPVTNTDDLRQALGAAMSQRE